MEALILIFAEIIFACLAPLLGLMGAVIAAIFEGIVLLLSLVFGTAAGSAATKRRKPRKALVSRKALHWTAGLLGGVGVLAVLATFVFFDPLLRSVLTRAGDKAEIVLAYEESRGSLLFGQVALTNLEMHRESDEGLDFNLRVDHVEADVDLWSLLGAEPRIQFAAVEGVSGRITPPVPKDKAATAVDVPKARKPFRADRVQVDDVALQIAPRGAEPYELKIAQGEVAPFRSKTALFDLLFRSNLSAEVAGQPLVVETREISANGRETSWDFDQVEVDRLRLVLPRAPLTWLEGGTVSVRVEDRWDLNDNEIDMDWRIDLDGIDVSAPETAGSAERLLANGLARAVARQGGDATFEYRLDLEPDQVAALRSGDLDAFWDTVLSGIIPARFARTPDADEEVGDEETGDEERGVLRRTFEVLKDKVARDE